MRNLLVVLGGGGHTKQMLRLVDKLGKEYRYEYVLASDDKLSERYIKFKGAIFRIINPRQMDDRGIIKAILKFVPSTLQAIIMLLKTDSEAILMAGPAICLHIAFLGRLLFKKKIIFLESWSRVYSKSWAGNAIYKLGLADLFFVQWPQEKKNYPKAIYAGRLG